MGVTCADLPDLDVLIEERLDVALVHNLGDDGHIELVGSFAQQVEALGAHALVCVRRSAGLVCAAA